MVKLRSPTRVAVLALSAAVILVLLSIVALSLRSFSPSSMRGQLCVAEGGLCSINAECCSNVCTNLQCAGSCSPPAAPGAPDLKATSDSGVSNTDDWTNDNTPTFTGTCLDSNTVTLYEASTPKGTATCSGGNYEITLSTVADGGHAYTAKQTNVCESTNSAPLTINVDTSFTFATFSPADNATEVGLNDNLLLDSAIEQGQTVYAVAGKNIIIKKTSDSSIAETIVASGPYVSISTVNVFTARVTVNPSVTLLAGTDYHVLIDSGAFTDTAGNSYAGISNAMTWNFTTAADTTAPSAPSVPDLAAGSDTGSSSTDNITSATTPTFTGTAEADSTVKLYANGSLVGSATATGGNYSITSSTLTDGTKSMTATATDTAGNVSSASSTLSATIDTTAPSAPGTPDLQAAYDSGSSSTDNITNNTSQVIDVSCENNATVTIVKSTDTSVTYGTGTCTSGTTAVSTTLSTDGTTYVMKAKQTDLAGNVSASYSSTLSILIDTTAPSASGTPDLDAASDSGSSSTDDITNDSTPSLSFTGTTGTTYVVYDGATSVATGTLSSSPVTATTSTLADGSHSITVKLTDTAGNTSAASGTFTVTIDTSEAAPGIPDLAAASDTGTYSTDNTTNNTTPTFSVSCTAGDTVRLYLDGSANGSSSLCPGGGSVSYTTAAIGTDGTYAFTATQTDTAGNVGVSSALSVTIDTIAPTALGATDLTAAKDSNIATDNITYYNTPTFTGACASGSIKVKADGTTVTSGSCSGAVYTITTATLADGTKAMTVTETDTAGNESTASATLTVIIDTTAPSAPSVPDLAAGSDTGSSSTDNITTATTPIFTGTAEAGSTVKLYANGSLVGSATATGGNYSIISSTLTDGTKSMTATATDTAGNTSAASSGLSVTIAAVTCGDGHTDGSEACDNGNATAGDGCSATCTVESGWVCSGSSPSSCHTVCGDGIVAGTEACDGIANGQTCLDYGYKGGTLLCSTSCMADDVSACATTNCGNGKVEIGEKCDDGNTTVGDGCSEICEQENPVPPPPPPPPPPPGSSASSKAYSKASSGGSSSAEVKGACCNFDTAKWDPNIVPLSQCSKTNRLFYPGKTPGFTTCAWFVYCCKEDDGYYSGIAINQGQVCDGSVLYYKEPVKSIPCKQGTLCPDGSKCPESDNPDLNQYKNTCRIGCYINPQCPKLQGVSYTLNKCSP